MIFTLGITLSGSLGDLLIYLLSFRQKQQNWIGHKKVKGVLGQLTVQFLILITATVKLELGETNDNNR